MTTNSIPRSPKGDSPNFADHASGTAPAKIGTVPIPPITYDYSGLIASDKAAPFAQQTGLLEADLNYLIPRLEVVRREMLWNLDLYGKGRGDSGGNAAARRRLLRPARAAAGRRPAAAGSDHRRRRPAGQGGRSGGGAGHRRLVHGRPGAVRGLLPSVSQRDFAPAARRPAANLLRGQQRRQRRRAGPARSGRGRATTGASSSSARAAARWKRPSPSASFSMPCENRAGATRKSSAAA